MNEHCEFNLRDVYLRLDSKQQGYIDAKSIMDFLRSRGSRYQEVDRALMFVNCYDRDHDCCLSYIELVKALTPATAKA